MPDFSPDGKKIAYVRDSGVAFAADSNLSIGVMDSDGANTSLTRECSNDRERTETGRNR